MSSGESLPFGLAIETSGRIGSLVLAEGTQVVAEHELPADRRHARDLMLVVQDLLRSLGRAPADLRLLAVDVGPGSYTGLRVGVTAVKTLAYALQAEVVALDQMALVAAAAPAEVARLAVLVDAQQDNVYVQTFAAVDAQGFRQPVDELRIEDARRFVAAQPAGTWLAGPSAARFAEPAAPLPDGVAVAPESWRLPRAATLWRLALTAWRTGRRDDFWSLEPLYLRPSSAEIKYPG